MKVDREIATRKKFKISGPVVDIDDDDVVEIDDSNS